jgi:hypothetical protein
MDLGKRARSSNDRQRPVMFRIATLLALIGLGTVAADFLLQRFNGDRTAAYAQVKIPGRLAKKKCDCLKIWYYRPNSSPIRNRFWASVAARWKCNRSPAKPNRRRVPVLASLIRCPITRSRLRPGLAISKSRCLVLVIRLCLCGVLGAVGVMMMRAIATRRSRGNGYRAHMRSGWVRIKRMLLIPMFCRWGDRIGLSFF